MTQHVEQQGDESLTKRSNAELWELLDAKIDTLALNSPESLEEVVSRLISDPEATAILAEMDRRDAVSNYHKDLATGAVITLVSVASLLLAASAGGHPDAQQFVLAVTGGEGLMGLAILADMRARWKKDGIR
jgi:hypothetical protein